MNYELAIRQHLAWRLNLRIALAAFLRDAGLRS
jgi:hypothetical protein